MELPYLRLFILVAVCQVAVGKESNQQQKETYAQLEANLKHAAVQYGQLKWDDLLVSSLALAHIIDELAVGSQGMTLQINAPTAAERSYKYISDGPISPQIDQLHSHTWEAFVAAQQSMLALNLFSLGLKDDATFLLSLSKKPNGGRIKKDVNATTNSLKRGAEGASRSVTWIISNLTNTADFLAELHAACRRTGAEELSDAATAEQEADLKQEEVRLDAEQEALVERMLARYREMTRSQFFYHEEIGEIELLLILLNDSTLLSLYKDADLLSRMLSDLFSRKQRFEFEVPDNSDDADSLERLEDNERLVSAVAALSRVLEATSAQEKKIALVNARASAALETSLSIAIEMVIDVGNKSTYFDRFEHSIEELSDGVSRLGKPQQGVDSFFDVLRRVQMAISVVLEETEAELIRGNYMKKVIWEKPREGQRAMHHAMFESFKERLDRTQERSDAIARDIHGTRAEIAALANKAAAANETARALLHVSRLLASVVGRWKKLLMELSLFNRTVQSIAGEDAEIADAFEMLANSAPTESAGDELLRSLLYPIEVEATALASVATVFEEVFRRHIIPSLAAVHIPTLSELTPSGVPTILAEQAAQNERAESEFRRICSERKQQFQEAMDGQLKKIDGELENETHYIG